MNENTGNVDLPSSNTTPHAICTKVHQAANVLQVPSSDENVFRFASKTISSGVDTLVTVKLKNDGKAAVVVNCEKMVIGSMLLKELKTSLLKE